MRATHIFTFGDKSPNNKAMFPQGVPVFAGPTDDQGYTVWFSDDDMNVAGYTKGYETNEFGSYVSVKNN